MTYNGTIFDINRDREASGRPPLSIGLAGRSQAELPLVPSSYVAPVDFTIGQKMLLLQVRGGSLAKQILEHARQWGGRISRDDRESLLAKGSIVWRDGRLNITPVGLNDASVISRDLAKKLGIHDITRRQAYGNMGPSAQCTCGFNVVSHRGRSGESNVAGQVGQHLRQVRAGTLPAAYRIAEPRS